MNFRFPTRPSLRACSVPEIDPAMSTDWMTAAEIAAARQETERTVATLRSNAALEIAAERQHYDARLKAAFQILSMK